MKAINKGKARMLAKASWNGHERNDLSQHYWPAWVYALWLGIFGLLYMGGLYLRLDVCQLFYGGCDDQGFWGVRAFSPAGPLSVSTILGSGFDVSIHMIPLLAPLAIWWSFVKLTGDKKRAGRVAAYMMMVFAPAAGVAVISEWYIDTANWMIGSWLMYGAGVGIGLAAGYLENRAEYEYIELDEDEVVSGGYFHIGTGAVATSDNFGMCEEETYLAPAYEKRLVGYISNSRLGLMWSARATEDEIGAYKVQLISKALQILGPLVVIAGCVGFGYASASGLTLGKHADLVATVLCGLALYGVGGLVWMVKYQIQPARGGQGDLARG